jgi:dUTP pyrophosphatase
MKLNVKLKQMNDGRHPIPKYATDGSAAVDFYAYIPQNPEADFTVVVLAPGQRKLIKLGVAMAIPEGYELRLSPRSGLALKQGITLTNSPGLIDSDYRGEIGAIVHNLGDEDFVINDGDKICQGGFYTYERAEFLEAETLDETERGAGGFGHTGV